MAAFNARLATLRGSSPFASIALPAAPTITSRVTVSNASELAAAQGMSGVEVTFAGSGFAGTLSPRSDQRWIFPAGFTLTGGVDTSAARRVELIGTGGRVAGPLTGNGQQDLRLMGMDIRTPAGNVSNLLSNCQRVLIEGSYVYASSYGLIYDTCNHFIVANSEVVSSGAQSANTRGAGSDLVLWMDTRLAMTTPGTTQQQFRGHRRTGRLAAFNVQIEGGTGSYFGSAGDGCPSVNDLVMLDNRYYGQGDTIFTEGCVIGGVFVGNHGYTPWGGGTQIPLNAPAGAIVANNPRSAYVAPPAWRRQ